MSKRTKIILIVISVLILAVVLSFFLVSKIFKIPLVPNTGGKPSDVSQSTGTETRFGKLIGDVDETTGENSKEYQNKMDVYSNSMSYAMRYWGSLQIHTPKEDFVTGEGEVLIEVVAGGEHNSYKVVASKNSFFKAGDTIPFNPIIDPESLIKQVDKNILHVSDGPSDFMIPEGLKPGDKVIFICEKSDCSDNKLVWAMVF
jgi:hypothetical protein